MGSPGTMMGELAVSLPLGKPGTMIGELAVSLPLGKPGTMIGEVTAKLADAARTKPRKKAEIFNELAIMLVDSLHNIRGV